MADKFLTLVALCVCLAIAPSSAFAEYLHCYLSNPPKSAKTATEELRIKAAGMNLGYQFFPIMYRKACGPLKKSDNEYLIWIFRSVGCSPESDVGQIYINIIANNAEGFDRTSELKELSDHDRLAFCTMVDRLEWPRGITSQTQASDPALDQFKKELSKIDSYIQNLRRK